jgi:putative MATE family efflux protein
MNQSDRAGIPILQLVGPIFVENVLRISLMSVDVFMLSRYSAKAAAAVGLINQLAFFLQLLYMMVALGASILISQNIGAGRKEEAGRTAVAGMVLGTLFAIVLSAGAALAAGPVLDLFSLEPEVYAYAKQFLVIYGGLSFFMALNIVQGAVARSYGYARDPMYVNIGANILNILGNALVLFGPFGFPVLGAAGVAASTVLAQALACLSMAIRMARRPGIGLRYRDIGRIPRIIYKRILGIGVPTAGENIAYNLGQIVIMSFIAAMGTNSLAASVYNMTLIRFIMIAGISIGSGAQIETGYLVGAGRQDQAQRDVFRYYLSGAAIALALACAFNLVRAPLISIFAPNAETAALTASVLLLAILYEPGRCFNTIIAPSLKGAGDVRFTVAVDIPIMWGVGVAGAYFLGLRLGMGLRGVILAMAADEWCRGIVMALRWKSGAWKSKVLVILG